MDAHARIVLDTSPSGVLLARELLTPAPLGARIADGELHLVSTAAGPLGGDRLRISLELRPGTEARLRSVAASVAQRGDGTGSSHHLEVTVGEGAHLDGDLEPLVAAAGCDHTGAVTIHLAAGASVRWRDELVLGRTGERPGCCTSTLRIERDGVPVLHHTVSTAQAGWDGPAVTAGAKVVGQIAVVGRPVGATALHGARAGWLRLDDEVGLAVALADDHAQLRRDLHQLVRHGITVPPLADGPARPGHPSMSGRPGEA
jgi:urease accessory protein